jgi:broad specificity phosphatase PhoE
MEDLYPEVQQRLSLENNQLTFEPTIATTLAGTNASEGIPETTNTNFIAANCGKLNGFIGSKNESQKNNLLLIITRHAEAIHNKAQTGDSEKKEYDFFSCHDEQYRDAPLFQPSENGSIPFNDEEIQELRGAARKALDPYLKETNSLPSPEVFYSSPLTRCVQTAIILVLELRFRKKDAEFTMPTISLDDRLREWIGVRHCCAADMRQATQDIIIQRGLKFAEDLRKQVPDYRDLNGEVVIEINFLCSSGGEDCPFVNLAWSGEAPIKSSQRFNGFIQSLYPKPQETRIIHFVSHNGLFKQGIYKEIVGLKTPEEQPWSLAPFISFAFCVQRTRLTEEEITTRNQEIEDTAIEQLKKGVEKYKTEFRNYISTETVTDEQLTEKKHNIAKLLKLNATNEKFEKEFQELIEGN